MKHKADLKSFHKGDYLELKNSDLLFVRVTNITQHIAYIGMSQIQMKVLLPGLMSNGGLISWDFEYLQPLLIRVIQSPTEKTFIRLLYD